MSSNNGLRTWCVAFLWRSCEDSAGSVELVGEDLADAALQNLPPAARAARLVKAPEDRPISRTNDGSVGN